MKYNKGFAPILIALIVVGVIAIGGVAYFAGKSSKVVPNVAVNNYQPTEEPNNINGSNSHEVPTGPYYDSSNYVAPAPLCNKDTTPWVKVLSPNGGETLDITPLPRNPNAHAVEPIGYIAVKLKTCNVSNTGAMTLSLIDSNNKELPLSRTGLIYDNSIQEVIVPFGLVSGKYKVFAGLIDPNKYIVSDTYVSSDTSDNFFTITISDQPKTMSVKVYYPNNVFDPGLPDCSVVYPLERTIPYTQAVAGAAFTELAKGPTEAEAKLGYIKVIPDGAKINSISITNGVASVDFNKKIEDNFTSCSGASRLSAIGKTLMQFPTIKELKYSVEGNSNQFEIFQP